MKDFINNVKKFDASKIQLKIAINFMSFKDTDKECLMNSKSDNIEIMINVKVDQVIHELFRSLLSQYQVSLETMKGSNFILDHDNLPYCKHHKMNSNCGGTCVYALN